MFLPSLAGRPQHLVDDGNNLTFAGMLKLFLKPKQLIVVAVFRLIYRKLNEAFSFQFHFLKSQGVTYYHIVLLAPLAFNPYGGHYERSDE